FYSRRVGRRPQHTPDLAEDEFADVPANTSILTALKLTGKTRRGLSIGILDAVTQRESAHIDLKGQRRQETVEPLTNYFVGRLQKDYNHGNTSIGGMVTALHRRLTAAQLRFLNRAAYSGGMDFRHQWRDKTYYLEAKAAFSHVRGDREAILQVQTASQRYFQRPDADYVHVDSSRTSLSGHGGMLSLGRGGNSRLRMNVGAMWRSPGFEINDLGFLRQADRVMQWSWLGYRVNNPFAIFRSLNFNFNQWWGWNFGGETTFAGGNINGGGQFKNYWGFWMGFGREGRNLSTSALRGGPALKLPGRWTQWYNLSTDSRKNVRFGLGGFNSWDDSGGSSVHNFRFWTSLQPINSMRMRINPFFTVNKDNLQYIATVENAGEDRFIFGRLRQKTFGITIRLDYSITPNLSIQYYGQPFISAGSYTELKRITDPRNPEYTRRFHVFNEQEVTFDPNQGVYNFDENRDRAVDYTLDKPDFNFRQFRSNLVLRWEYTPGSTVFLVWTQERTGSGDTGRFAFGGELGNLFADDATDVFLIKISRWLSL
ncbi:MAG: hypothetical protein D6743_06170, partial [Calditrichaeota bacterium]